MGSQVIDAGTGKVGRTPAAPTDAVVVKSWDGAALAAEVHHSATSRPHGLVVFVHGFAGNRHENGLFDGLARRASSIGFDSVLYDWRGIGDSQGDFRETTIDDHVKDLESVLAWAGERFQGAGPICLVGFSLGAAVVGLALRRGIDADRVIYISPAMRPSLSMWPRYDTSLIRREIDSYGFIQKPGSSVLLGRAILESLRDTDLGDDSFDIGIPLLVCHGTDDTRINCANSRELAERVRKSTTFRYVEFPGASHSFRPERDFWPELGTTITDWLVTARPAGKARARSLATRA